MLLRSSIELHTRCVLTTPVRTKLAPCTLGHFNCLSPLTSDVEFKGTSYASLPSDHNRSMYFSMRRP